MIGYTILRWRVADEVANRVAIRTLNDLRSLGWHVAIEEPGWAVAVEQFATVRFLKMSANGRRVLIGSVFDRGTTRAGPASAAFDLSQSVSFSELARALSSQAWGSYVAVAADGADPDRIAIFRDPIGELDCVTWRSGGVRLVSSTPELMIISVPPAGLAPDWSRVGELLAFPASVGETLPMSGLVVVAAGTLVRCRGDHVDAERLWHPVDVRESPSLRTPDRALALSGVVDACVEAWCSDAGRAIAELSGGLDSAIVAAAASRATAASPDRWFHYSSDDVAGDERAFAEAIATYLSLPLTCSVQHQRQVDAAVIDTMPVAVRPGLGAVSLFHDHDLASHASAIGADAILTGHGGDAIFFQPATTLVAADLWSDCRRLTQKLSAITDIATWTGSPLWSVVKVAIVDRLRRTPVPVNSGRHSFLGKDFGQRAPSLPWSEGIDHLAPAKQLQISMIAASRSAFGASWSSQGRRMIHPLMSQPLIEHVLAIPVIDLTYGRRERALARDAFADRLPAALIERRGKGDLTLYFGRMLAASTGYLRNYLMDGILATQGVIDRKALEPILSADYLMQTDEYASLITAIVMERWSRVWADRLAGMRD